MDSRAIDWPVLVMEVPCLMSTNRSSAASAGWCANEQTNAVACNYIGVGSSEAPAICSPLSSQLERDLVRPSGRAFFCPLAPDFAKRRNPRMKPSARPNRC